MSTFQSYLEQYALLSLEKQEKLGKLIGDNLMELDLDAGMVRFSGGLEFPFQVLGTESENTLTWLWGWAEEQTEVPEELLKSALQMRDWGQRKNLPECTNPSVDLDRADGNAISLVASEVCKASCYYHDVYQGGSLFLLLFNEAIDRGPSLDAAGFSRQLSYLKSLYEINFRTALISYLRAKDLSFAEQGPVVEGELESGESIRAQFDSDGNILSLNDKALPLI